MKNATKPARRVVPVLSRACEDLWDMDGKNEKREYETKKRKRKNDGLRVVFSI